MKIVREMKTSSTLGIQLSVFFEADSAAFMISRLFVRGTDLNIQ
jgi:hypothetical protein